MKHRFSNVMCGMLQASVLGGLLLLPALAQGSGGTAYQDGVVDTRGLVLGPNGYPEYVQYDDNGVIVAGATSGNGSWPVEEVGDDAKDWVMSGDVYRSIVSNYETYLNANQNGVARGAYILTADAYNKDLHLSISNGGFYGIKYGTSGKQIKFSVSTPALANDSIKSVLVRAPETIPDISVLSSQGVMLMGFPVDLTSGNLQHLPDNIKSVLLNAKGQIRRTSAYTIGLRAAFLPPAPGDTSHDDVDIGRPGVTPLSPVVGAKITSNGYSTYTTYTQDDGKFRLLMNFPACPGYTDEYHYTLNVGLKYKPFNPAAPSPTAYYYFRSVPAYYFCDGYGEVPLGTSQEAIDTTTEIQAITATIATSRAQLHIPVDVTMISGTLRFTNETDNTARVSDPVITTKNKTGYHDDAPPAPATISPAATAIDFNGDHYTDKIAPAAASHGGPTKYDVWLSKPASTAPSAGSTSPPADFQRVVDYAPDFNNEGLLQQISLEDAKDTSLYVYRVSDGKLIASEKNLSDDDITHDDAGNPVLHYRVVIPGSQGWDATSNAGVTDTAWQVNLKSSDSNPHHFDSLRPGEQVEVVAVNRKTGYIGTATLALQAPGRQTTTPSTSTAGSLDVNHADIALAPPNLKIEAERTYTLDDKDAHHLIGYQGDALASDTYVVIKTIWLDEDGTALPSTPDGFSYTGRLAKVISKDGNLGVVKGAAGSGSTGLNKNGLAEFSIMPGVHTQVVQLRGQDLSTDHFYIDVSGEPKYDPSNFISAVDSGSGDGTRLSYRPSHYVPLRIPVYDEAASNQLRDQYQYLGSDLSTPPAVYQWPYRPEMAFSVLDLALQSLTLSQKSGSGTTTSSQTIDLTGPTGSSGIMNALLSNSNLDAIQAELVYSLTGSAYPLLPTIGAAPQQLIFAVGGDEELAVLGADGNVTFTHLGSLNDVQGSDLEALSLYDNADPSNILWQVEAPGLHVYYQVADDLEPVGGQSIDPSNPTQPSPDGNLSYWTLGGMRLELTYVTPEPLAGAHYAWHIDADGNGIAGRYSTKKFTWTDPTADPTSYINSADGPDDSSVYWEPDSWELPSDVINGTIPDDAFDGTVMVTYLDAKRNQQKLTKAFHILRRKLVPDSTHPMQGSDVAMLENVLWHLGLSPQYDQYATGSEGNRLGTMSNTLRTYVGGAAGATARQTYSTGDGLVGYEGSMEKMVRRFQGHSFASPVPGSSARDQAAQAGEGQDGKVENNTLLQLGEVWKHYVVAYDENMEQPEFTEDNIPDSWWDAATQVLDQGGNVPYIDTPATTPPYPLVETLTSSGDASQLKQITTAKGFPADAAGLRVRDILYAWNKQESGGEYWGAHGHPTTPFRVHTGGADEYGSMGFNHILWRRLYGTKLECDSIRGYIINGSDLSGYVDNVNLYVPKNSLLAFVAATADGACIDSDSLYMAYAAIGTTGTSGNTDQDPKSPSPIARVITASAPQWFCYEDKTASKSCAADSSTWVKFDGGGDDAFDVLGKAIMMYNAGTRTSLEPMVKRLMSDTPHFSKHGSLIPKKYAYWLTIKLNSQRRRAAHGYLPFRTYIWKVISGTTSYCFAYGEEDWMNPDKDAKGRLMLWNDYKLRAQFDIKKQVTCKS